MYVIVKRWAFTEFPRNIGPGLLFGNWAIFGLFGLSTKEPYTVILCPLLALASSASVSSSVHTPPPGTSPTYAHQILSDSDL